MKTAQLLDLTHDVFFRDIFPMFNKITDTQSNLEYKNDFFGTDPEPRIWSISKAWHCIYLRRYEEAIRYINSYIDTMSISYPSEGMRETKDGLNGYDKYQDIMEAFKDANIQKEMKSKSKLERILQLLESLDYDALDTILKQRIDNAHLVCREFFGVRRFPL